MCRCYFHQFCLAASDLDPLPGDERHVTKSISERKVSGPDKLSGTLRECVLSDFQNGDEFIHN